MKAQAISAQWLVCCMLVLLAGCKRLPEGGTRFNVRMMVKNETRTFWDIERYEVDGIDSTFMLISSGDNALLRKAFSMFESKYTYYYTIWGGNATSYSVDDFSRLGFGSTGSGTDLINNVRFRNILCPEGTRFTWDIRRCKRKTLILEGNTTKKYRLVLHKS